MLLIPTIVGWFYRQHMPGSTPALDTARVAMIIGWLVSYGWFYAVTGLAKAAPTRRGRYIAPLAVYTVVGVLAGLISIAAFGWQVAGWALIFGPLAAVGITLSFLHRDRSVLAGFVAILATSLFMWVIVEPKMFAFFRAWNTPNVITLRWITVVIFGYFFGTVFVVKTMIRKRGKLSWFYLSGAYHLAVVLTVAYAVTTAQLPMPFIAFAIATLLRAVALPLAGPLRTPALLIKPVVIGLIETVFSVVLLILLLILVVF